MLAVLILTALACASAAPPNSPQLYQNPGQLQQINPLDYYVDSPDVAQYYSPTQQKQANANTSPNGAPSRLETLEPDSEVELIPGAQQPQQPPQQTPVSPNIPGLIPGQRVFIVHMPVPGYRPGSIGGYQPVYIVAAAPQGNNYNGYPANGYQNAILLDPSGQPVVSPVAYPRPGYAGVNAVNPNYVFGAPLVNRPYNVFQDPGYQQGNPRVEGFRQAIRLNQLVALQAQPAPAQPREEAQPNEKRSEQLNNESKENAEEPQRNSRPTPPHAQARTP